jgi:hypothetical protein
MFVTAILPISVKMSHGLVDRKLRHRQGDSDSVLHMKLIVLIHLFLGQRKRHKLTEQRLKVFYLCIFSFFLSSFFYSFLRLPST